jgi:cell wall-associated NlpC family hydrolase
MRNHKGMKKMVWTVAASLLVTAFIPTGISHAATLTTAQTNSDNIQSVFSKFGLDWIFDNSRAISYSAPIQNKEFKPVSNNQSTAPAQTQNLAQGPANNTTAPGTEQEQSNGHRLQVADNIIKLGEQYLGTPYKLGSPSGVTSTFDCSSFVQYVYGKNGIHLPRSSREQAQVGQTIPRSEIQKGDLLFFTTSHSNGKIGHVAIYAGNNKVLHTWGPGGVRFDSLDEGWLKAGYVTAKRVIPDK